MRFTLAALVFASVFVVGFAGARWFHAAGAELVSYGVAFLVGGFAYIAGHVVLHSEVTRKRP